MADRCRVVIRFGDDYGDNETTFRCGLNEGHRGEHVEEGEMDEAGWAKPYRLTWRNVRRRPEGPGGAGGEDRGG